MTLEAPRYAGSEADSTSIGMSTTTLKLQKIVERQLDLLITGQIPQLS